MAAWMATVNTAGSVDALLQSALMGVGSMPAFAGQFTETELADAINYASGGVMPVAVNNPPQVLPANLPAVNLTTSAAPLQITLAVTDDGPIADLTFDALSSQPAFASVAHNGGGQFTLMALAAGTAEITLSVTDGENTVQRSFTVTVTEPITINDPPNVTPASLPDLALLTSDSAVNVSLIVSDEQPGLLQFVAVSSAMSVATVTHSGNGMFVVTPAAAGSTTITLTVTDDGDNVVTRMFGVTVTAPPAVTGQSLVEAECLVCHAANFPGAPQFGDSAAWDAAVTAAGSQQALVGSVANGLGAMPQFGSRFSNALLTQAVDYLSGGAQPSTDAPPMVSPVNLPPLTLATNNPPLSITLTVTDNSPELLSYSAQSSDTSVAAVNSTGNGNFSIVAGMAGQTQITLSVTDENSNTVERSFMVTVTESITANDPPVVSPTNLANVELSAADNPITVTLSVSDENPAALQFASQVGNPAVATVTHSGNGVFQIAPGAAGQSQISLNVTDDADNTVSRSFSITVTAVAIINSGQALVEAECLVCHGTNFPGAPQFGDNASWTTLVTNAGGAQNLLPSVQNGLGAMPAFGGRFSGQLLVDAIGYLSGGVMPSQNLPPIVTPANLPNVNLATNNAALPVSLMVSDENNGALSFTAQSSNTSVATALSLGNGQFTVSPSGSGSATVTLSVTDDANNTVTRDFQVSVTESVTANDPPLVSPANLNDLSVAQSDGTVSVQLTASDESVATLSYTATSSAIGVATVSHTGNGLFEIAPIAAGTSQITLTVSDDAGNSVTRQFTITVSTPETLVAGQALVQAECLVCHGNNFPGAPQFGDDATWSGLLGTGLDNLLNSVINGRGAMPAFGSRFSTVELTEAINFLSGGASATVPTAADNDLDTIANAVDNCPTIPNQDQIDSDGNGVGDACESADAQNNQRPIAQADNIVITGSQASQILAITANDSDPEGSALTIIIVSNVTFLGGQITLAGEIVSYIPPSDFITEDRFTYQVADSQGLLSDEVQVTLLPSDLDADGVVDSLDNCRLLPNADQADQDGDGAGDACDTDPDGDGIAGPASGLVSGRQLVESECLVCHLSGVGGAPLFGDDATWNELIEQAGGMELLLESVVNGRGIMPAFGNRFSSTDLLSAVIYITGREDEDLLAELPSSDVDADLDGIFDILDNCLLVPNSDQLDSDDNGVGDACEATADNDGDGIPILFDDNDADANRIPSHFGDGSNVSFFISDQSLSIGEFATAVFNETGRVQVVISDDELGNAIVELLPTVPFQTDDDVRDVSGIVNLNITELGGESAQIIVQLFRNLPLHARLRIYQPQAGAWVDFAVSGSDEVSSAASFSQLCPATESLNYQAGLSAGLNCIRLLVADGGVNDADSMVNGTVVLLFRIGALVANDQLLAGPETINVNPGRGGLAALSGMISLILLLLVVIRIADYIRSQNRVRVE